MSIERPPITYPPPVASAVCAVCDGPLIPVSDDPHDPDPEHRTHPGCAPANRAHWERLLAGGPNATREDLPSGTMRATWWSRCPRCGRRIRAGELQSLTDVGGHQRWVCARHVAAA